MSFRKRNVGLSSTLHHTEEVLRKTATKIRLPGVRPSPLDGRATTSTGTASLDGLLAGHVGLALGCSLLIEENGTTDFAGAILRFYAAEGLLQGHQVHVLALPEIWGRELPGVVGKSESKEQAEAKTEKMKIAWRYESLGAGPETPKRDRLYASTEPTSGSSMSAFPEVFCHTFDLTKRLVHPPSSKIDFIPLGASGSQSPFTVTLDRLASILSNSPPNSVHRVVVPSLLSPALYPPNSSLPQNVLGLMQGLRALLGRYEGRLTAMLSLPISLYPRNSGLVRWIELLCDGVLELAPFPHTSDAEQSSKAPPGSVEEPPQGLLKLHRLPILQDRGSGITANDDDWTFSLSRRKFTIKPYNLPPMEGDNEAQHAAGADQKAKQSDMDF